MCCVHVAQESKKKCCFVLKPSSLLKARLFPLNDYLLPTLLNSFLFFSMKCIFPTGNIHLTTLIGRAPLARRKCNASAVWYSEMGHLHFTVISGGCPVLSSYKSGRGGEMRGGGSRSRGMTKSYWGKIVATSKPHAHRRRRRRGFDMFVFVRPKLPECPVLPGGGPWWNLAGFEG